MKRQGISKQNLTQGSGSCGVDEDVFLISFEQVPSVIICSYKDVVEIIEKIKVNLNSIPEEWEKRVEGLKRIRSLLIAEAQQYSDFLTQLREIEMPVQSCISDLRSQVVREACITVAFVAYKLTSKAERFLEGLLESLICLIQNSAKIISSSGITALTLILKHSQSPRYIPVFTKELSSKSNITRRYVCEMLRIMCSEWSTHCLERYMGQIQEGIKKGLNDADQDARAASRLMFIAFYNHFPDQGNELLNSLDPSKRRLLEKELGISSSSSFSMQSTQSTTSLNSTNRSATPSGATLNSLKQARAVKSAAAPANNVNARQPPAGESNELTRCESTFTLSSEEYVDTIEDSNERARKLMTSTMDRSARTAGRRIGIQSQPASRDASPHRSITNLSAGSSDTQSSRGGTTAKTTRPLGPPNATRTRTAGGYNAVRGPPARVPKSQGASRDTSPERDFPEPWNHVMGTSVSANTATAVASSVANGIDGEALSRMRRNSCADSRGKLYSDQSSDRGLSETLSRVSGRRDEMDDNASEISSVASDAAFTGQPSRIIDNILEILTILQSASWKERRDGLLNFQLYLRDGKPLKHGEVQKLSEIFTRLFNDTKGKVFINLLDTIQLFIEEYHSYLSSWLYILLVRLLTKQGNDLLASHQDVILETLNVIRCTFRCSLQFQCCCKFIQDGTQTPNLRTKNSLLVYMQSLLAVCNADDVYGDATNTDMVMAFAKIINYTMEPKSPEIRKNTEEVLWRLFDLDPVRWNNIVFTLGKSFQENAMRVIHRRVGSGDGLAGNNNNSKSMASFGEALAVPNIQQRSSESRRSSLPGGLARSSLPHRGSINSATALPASKLSISSNHSDMPSPKLVLNATPQDVAISVKQVTDNLHSLALNQPSVMPTSPVPAWINDHVVSRTNTVQEQSKSFQTVPSSEYPSNTANPMPEDMPTEEDLGEILQDLSNHNERNEHRKLCMSKMGRLIRMKSGVDWDEYFKTTLFLLLEILGDSEIDLRAQSLRVLQDLLVSEPHRFQEYTHLTVMKILEANRDPQKTVSTAAEECAKAVAQILSSPVLVSVLHPIIVDCSSLIITAAIKMLQHHIAICDPDVTREIFHHVTPALIKACNDMNSQIRKCAIFCLVEIYFRIGDECLTTLQNLGFKPDKMRLLQLFIDRRNESTALPKTNSVR